MSDAYELKDRSLKQLMKALKIVPNVRIGIMADRSARTEGGKTNAQVGAAHEYGTSTLPQRSFLRMPISEKLEGYLENSGAFAPEVLNEVVRTGDSKPWMLKVASTAEQVVADAFATGGFGQWKPSDMRYKENQQTLVETQQLRNAITSEVK